MYNKASKTILPITIICIMGNNRIKTMVKDSISIESQQEEGWHLTILMVVNMRKNQKKMMKTYL